MKRIEVLNRIMIDVAAADVRDSTLSDGVLYSGQARFHVEL